MLPPVAFDMTRLFVGPITPTPRGIDRVDLAFAHHFFSDPKRNVWGVLPTALGIRVFNRDWVLRAVEQVERLWAENCPADGDRLLQAVRECLVNGQPIPPPEKPPKAFSLGTSARRIASVALKARLSIGQHNRNALQPGTFYINTGQIGLAIPRLLRWLDRRPDVCPIFMLHDVIPIETPEYVSAASCRFHARMVDTTYRHAGGLIVTTQVARDAVGAEIALRGGDSIPTFLHPLPVADIFRSPPHIDPELFAVPYFVVCGSLEPRKNHAMLLEVWKRLVARFGDRAPHLVVVGAIGWGGEAIRHRLQSAPTTRNRIHLISGLSSRGLARLIANSRALLMPSFIEGFGLPVIEALAQGTPVIASDIPAHREVGSVHATFVDPIDAPGWLNAIVEANEQPQADRRSQIDHLPDWPAYFRAFDDFLATAFEARRRAKPV